MNAATPTCESKDRVLVATRVLGAVVAPVLIAAFIMLYLLPGDTDRLFAWPIGPQMSAMMLGATYLGGAYFFVRVLLARSWRSIKLGLLPVSSFSAILGVATILHWEAFTAGHISFILWAFLYFTLPFVIPAVWYWNRRANAGAVPPDEPLMPVWLGVAFGALGVVLIGAAILLFVAPQTMIDIWPWTLSPLTSRVMAAMFALAGGVALGIAMERRWSSARIPLQAQAFSIVLFLLAMAIARNDIAWDSAGSWLFIAGMLYVLVLIARAAVYARGGETVVLVRPGQRS
jgi:hypothetical protein